MTCIAGVTDGTTVWIGGDSAAAAGYSYSIRADKKVFHNGEFIMGFTDSFRMGQLLQYKLQIPPQKENQNIMKYMVTDFIDAVRDCLNTNGYGKTENKVESGGTFLVGYRGHLFAIYSDYQVEENLDGLNAVGCGADIARGVLYATKDMYPESRIELAIEAAANYNSGVMLPVHIVQTTPAPLT